MTTKQINGFKVLGLKFSEKNTSYHEIFIKEHIVRHQSAETPAERTLFVVNIPPYATEESIKRVFSTAGPVSNVIFKKNVNVPHTDINTINGFKVAYVVFSTPKGLLNALKLTKLPPLSTPESPVLCGMQKWIKQYNDTIVDPKILENNINEYMSDYDLRMKRKKEQEKAAGEEDDEGWVTVTKQSRNPGVKQKKIEQKLKEKFEKRQQKKELKNFYTFQIRESKMKHLATLRKKFEEDKKKINTLKQARKFKPF